MSSTEIPPPENFAVQFIMEIPGVVAFSVEIIGLFVSITCGDYSDTTLATTALLLL